MINLSENVARMRKRHRGVLLDFDLSRVIFEAVIRCEIYWLKLILAKITIILAKCIAKFHKLCSLGQHKAVELHPSPCPATV